MVVAVHRKVVAISQIDKKANGYESDSSVMGIAIKSGIRDVAVGTEMVTLIEQAWTMPLEVLTISALINKRVHV